MGTPFYAEFLTYLFSLTCLPVSHWRVIIVLASSPHVCGRCLLVWVMSMTPFPLSVLAASTCMAAVQHHLLLVLVSCHVLCPMRPTRCHILHSLGWGLCLALGVPLPLAVDPMGCPYHPRPGILTRGTQISTELPLQLSCIALVEGQWCMCAASLFATDPLTME
jgi:hypothetical protein